MRVKYWVCKEKEEYYGSIETICLRNSKKHESIILTLLLILHQVAKFTNLLHRE